MGLDKCCTVGTLNKTGSYELPVSASLVSASFGCFSLRYCHNLHLLYFYKKDLRSFALLFFVLAVEKLLELAPSGIDLARSASAFVADHFLSALGAESAAIGRAEKS